MPELKHLWSYPADGATDVPLDATFWTASTGAFGLEAQLNGRPIESFPATQHSAHRIEPGLLRPNTAYTLTLTYLGRGSEALQQPLTLSFRTGKKRAASVPAPSIAKHQDSQADFLGDASCDAISMAQGCFDTIGPTPTLRHTLKVTDTAVLGWVIEGTRNRDRQLWPAMCGSPSLIIPNSQAEECFDLRAIGAGGRLSEATRHCAQTDPAHFAAHTRMLTPPNKAPTPPRRDAVLPRAEPALQEAPEPTRSLFACSTSMPQSDEPRTLVWMLAAVMAFRLRSKRASSR